MTSATTRDDILELLRENAQLKSRIAFLEKQAETLYLKAKGHDPPQELTAKWLYVRALTANDARKSFGLPPETVVEQYCHQPNEELPCWAIKAPSQEEGGE